jgi:hypothetical protein
MSHETLKWKLFLFSLKWYAQTARGVKGDWEVLRNKFYLAFFPESPLVDLHMEVLGFRQKEKETLGAAWARFSDLNMSSPNLELSELMLLQHFRRGLSKESAQSLDISSGGAFTNLTPSEGRNVFNKILENIPYTGIFDEFPEEEVDEILELENEILPIQPTPVTTSLSEPIKVGPPVENHHSLEVEETHLMDFISEIEDDLFSDIGNALNFPIHQNLKRATLHFNKMLANTISPFSKKTLNACRRL